MINFDSFGGYYKFGNLFHIDPLYNLETARSEAKVSEDEEIAKGNFCCVLRRRSNYDLLCLWFETEKNESAKNYFGLHL
jgi:hypothetical protein